MRLIGASWVCLGLVPEVDRVGEECGELEEVELLESVCGGDAGAGSGAGAGGGAGGATGGAGFVAGGVPANICPNGCSFGIEVQLFWNSGTVYSSTVRNL